MRVIYKLSIQDKILKAVYDASRQNKEIEKIILTRPEWKELCSYWSAVGAHTIPCNSGCIFSGVRLEVEE